jgi:hypothetical protein
LRAARPTVRRIGLALSLLSCAGGHSGLALHVLGSQLVSARAARLENCPGMQTLVDAVRSQGAHQPIITVR